MAPSDRVFQGTVQDFGNRSERAAISQLSYKDRHICGKIADPDQRTGILMNAGTTADADPHTSKGQAFLGSDDLLPIEDRRSPIKGQASW